MGDSLSQLAFRDRLSGTSFDRCVPLRTVKSSSTATYNLDYPWRQHPMKGREKESEKSEKNNTNPEKANDIVKSEHHLCESTSDSYYYSD